MKRQDWLWLLIKAAGLWLIVAGIEELAAVGYNTFRPSSLWDQGSSEEAVSVLLLLGCGLFLLLADVSKWLQRIDRQSAAAKATADSAATAEPAALTRDRMRREDWLWVGLKLLGAYFFIQGVGYLLTFTRFARAAGDGSLWDYAAGSVYVLFGLLLILSERVYLLASRCSRSRLPSPD